MYLRWKYKRRVRNLNGERYTLSAYLVVSHRKDGKINQKIIKYLGSIRSEYIQYQQLRRKFWGNVNANLSELNITEKEKEKIRLKLGAKVPQAADKEINDSLMDIREKIKF